MHAHAACLGRMSSAHRSIRIRHCHCLFHLFVSISAAVGSNWRNGVSRAEAEWLGLQMHSLMPFSSSSIPFLQPFSIGVFENVEKCASFDASSILSAAASSVKATVCVAVLFLCPSAINHDRFVLMLLSFARHLASLFLFLSFLHLHCCPVTLLVMLPLFGLFFFFFFLDSNWSL